MTDNEYLMPDDLIRQKEWLALTAGEKEWLKDFAAGEAEYNLLRHMLLTAAKQPALANGPGPQVEEQLKTAFAAEKKRRSMVVVWRYAAAAAVLVAIAGYIIWQIRPAAPGNDALAVNRPAARQESVTAAETKTTPAETLSAETMADSAAGISSKKELSGPKDAAAGSITATNPKMAAEEMTAGAPPPQTTTDQAAERDVAFEKKLPVAPLAVSARVKDNEGLAGLVTAVY